MKYNLLFAATLLSIMAVAQTNTNRTTPTPVLLKNQAKTPVQQIKKQPKHVVVRLSDFPTVASCDQEIARLEQRIQTVKNDPKYAPIAENSGWFAQMEDRKQQLINHKQNLPAR